MRASIILVHDSSTAKQSSDSPKNRTPSSSTSKPHAWAPFPLAFESVPLDVPAVMKSLKYSVALASMSSNVFLSKYLLFHLCRAVKLPRNV